MIEMKMTDYEEKAAELTAQAQRLEATMLTFEALSHCVDTYHDFEFWYDEEPSESFIQGLCKTCGIFIKAENFKMWFDERNEEGFGDLAGKTIDEIEIETETPPPVATGIDDSPVLESEQDSSGTYKVDVSSIIGKQEE